MIAMAPRQLKGVRRHQKGISLHRIVYGFNNWIVVSLLSV